MTDVQPSDSANELLVDTPNPAALDQTLQQMGAVLVGGPDYVVVDGHYIIRALGDVGYVKFACETQGYCTVIAGPGNWLAAEIEP